MATDHAPYPKEEKEAGLKDMLAAPNGIPGLETFLPLMLNAVNEGWLTLERLVEVTAENPAKIYRVWPQEGQLHARGRRRRRDRRHEERDARE